MADREDPNTVIGRLEGHISSLRTTSPSGSETIHDKIAAELANLRRAINGPTEAEKAADEEKAYAEHERLMADESRGPPSPKAPAE